MYFSLDEFINKIEIANISFINYLIRERIISVEIFEDELKILDNNDKNTYLHLWNEIFIEKPVSDLLKIMKNMKIDSDILLFHVIDEFKKEKYKFIDFQEDDVNEIIRQLKDEII